MDDREKHATEQGALTRILAMLLSLAALAECASGRSRAMRCLVLWILRPAESAARRFVIEVFEDFALEPADFLALEAVCEIPFLRSGDSAADAMRLALRFRALATALDDLPWQDVCFSVRAGVLEDRLSRFADALRRVEIGAVLLPAACAPRAGAWNDSS